MFDFERYQTGGARHEREVSEKNRKMFKIVNEVYEAFKRSDIDGWVIGGLAVEGLRGEITREHHDADFAIWKKDKEKVKNLLQKEGFKLIEWRRDKADKLYKLKHGFVARKEGVDTEFVFLVYDEKGNTASLSIYEKFKFPRDLLEGRDVAMEIKRERFVFRVSTPELLLALKLNSNREIDKRDVEFLSQQITDEEKINNIQSLALDYNKLKKSARAERLGR